MAHSKFVIGILALFALAILVVVGIIIEYQWTGYAADCRAVCSGISLDYQENVYLVPGGVHCVCGNLTRLPVEATP